jgi:diguanylate cyclase (GGDEF)-like protein/PAS domain S-box-containing protein
MIARPDLTEGLQAAPGLTGARQEDVTCGLVPLTEASCVLASIGDALILTDLAGRITYLNPAAVRLTGWAASDAVGQPLDVVLTLISESTRQPVANTATRCLVEGRSVDLEDGVVLVRRDGSEVPIGDSAAPVRDDDGALIGVVLVIQDEGEKRRIGRRLSYEASHDALTGMINRREFDRRLARIVGDPGRRTSDKALLVIDLDRFKAVNDGSGHEAGDALLAHLAPLLRRHLRTGDTLARLGGDEFGVLLEDRALSDAERVAEALRAAIAAHRFEWGGRVHTITASVGLTPLVASAGDAAAALRAADAASYEAKEAGGNRVRLEYPGQPVRNSRSQA